MFSKKKLILKVLEKDKKNKLRQTSDSTAKFIRFIKNINVGIGFWRPTELLQFSQNKW